MAQNQLVTGPQQVGDGSQVQARAGKNAETMVTELNGRYYEQGYRGLMFYAVNSAAQALSLSNTTTYTGLTVANPTGSNKNLILLEAIWCTTIAATGVGAVILGTGATTTQTTGSSTGPVSTVLGSGAGSVAKVGASTTYGSNPAFLRPFIGVAFGTSVGINMLQNKDDIGGAVIIPPGQQVSFVAVTTAITGVGYFSWCELPQ
jgi:hypothetical protein